MSRFGDVSVEIGDDFVADVCIHRPPSNFFDTALIRDIAQAYEMLDGDASCRAIVLCAEGKHFCAGAQLVPDDGLTNSDTADELYGAAARLFDTATPVVAAIHGAAIGGGLGLACSADFRVAAPEARLSCNFTRLGFHPGFGLSLTLPLIVGRQRAMELAYTGRRIDGTAAHRIGLVDRLTALDRVRPVARDLACEIAAAAPLAVRAIRRTMRGHLAAAFRSATAHEGTEQDRLRATADFAEGLRAASERRVPVFVER